MNFKFSFSRNKGNAWIGSLLWLILAIPTVWPNQARLSFNHITSADGLPQNTISAMHQDRYGFLWLGTHDGLHKYDGYEFISYKFNPRNPKSISSNVITAIVEDEAGFLWVGTAQSGLNKLDPMSGEFTRYQYSPTDFDSLSHNHVTALHIDHNNQLWVGTYNGLNIFNAANNQFEHLFHNPLDANSIPNGSVTAITNAGKNQLYVATTDMLARFDTEQFLFHRYDSFESPTRINTIYIDEDNSLWVGTQLEGLYHLTYDSKTFAQYVYDTDDLTSLSSNNIKTLLRDSKGNLWVGTEQGGLNLKQRGSRDFTRFQKNAADSHSISINDIWSLLEDKSGQIWIGTAGGGLNKTIPHFQNFLRLQHSPFDQNSLSHNFVWNIKQDSQGKIWFATLNGIDSYDPITEQFHHFSTFVSQENTPVSNRITTLATDPRGKVWFGNQDGQVARFDPNKNPTQVQLFDRSGFIHGNFSNARIRLITLDRMDNIWIATDEGLAMLDGDTGSMLEDFRYASVGELGTSSVYTMMQDDQGIMWFGTWDSGLQRYDPEFKQTLTFRNRSDQEFSLSDNTVRSIYQDKQGNIWIGTYNGLNLLKNSDRLSGNFKFYSFFEANGLPNNTIYSITSDDSGLLWLSTNRGLSRFNPATQTFKNFTSIDGLPADEFNGNSALNSRNGLLYFGSISGVAKINPIGITENRYQPPKYISQVLINGEPYFKNRSWHPTPNLVLNHEQNNLVFKFSALDFQVPSRIQYAYRLSPFQTEWQEIVGKNEVQFGNLKPGDYQFEFKSTNSDGVWFDSISSLPIKIHPPMWDTWWAYIIYVALIISLIAIYLIQHRRKLQEQKEVNEHLRRVDRLKDEFLANTSHELRTPLNGIIGIAESLREGIAGPLNDKARGHLNLIVDSGKRLAHQVNEILDFKKLRHHGLLLNRRPVDLRVAAKVVINLLKPLSEEKQLQMINSLPQFLPHAFADENRVRQILYNLLGNAIKYTESGFIEITARVTEDALEVCVKDSGIGIAENKLQLIFKPFEQADLPNDQIKGGTGLGLAVTQQLVELHKGKLWVKSKIGQGSSFYFTLPISQDDQIESFETPLIEENKPVSKNLSFAKPAPAANLVGDANKAHILVVDDDPLNRQVLFDFLSMRGYRITESANGLEAVEKTTQDVFDLIILDVMMPKMSGFEATEKIRERFSLLELPILLLSAKNQPDDINTGLSVGANDYISKPVDRKILMARVSNLLMLREVFNTQQQRTEFKAMEQTFNHLSRYFPRPLVERILEGDETKEIQPERRCISVCFIDIVGFTEFSDRFEPEAVTDVLNEFIAKMSQIVEQHQGLLNEVLGDGLVVFFGALEQMDKTNQAMKAVKLAIDMHKAMASLTEKWRSTGLEQQLQLRIGIHQSYVTLGNFGSQEMIVFRAVGSGVNLAARIQGMSQPGGTLVSYPVFAQTESHFNFSEFEEVQFKGFNHKHKIYRLLD